MDGQFRVFGRLHVHGVVQGVAIHGDCSGGLLHARVVGQVGAVQLQHQPGRAGFKRPPHHFHPAADLGVGDLNVVVR